MGRFIHIALALTAASSVSADYQRRGAMITAAPFYAPMVRRQDSGCAVAGQTTCPGGPDAGCCPDGAACTTAEGQLACASPCDGNICDVGLCCDIGEACPTEAGGFCTPTLGGSLPSLTDDLGDPGFTDSDPGFTDSDPGFTDSDPGFTDSDPDFTDSDPGLTASASGFTDSEPTLTGSPAGSEPTANSTPPQTASAGGSGNAFQSPTTTGSGPVESAGSAGSSGSSGKTGDAGRLAVNIPSLFLAAVVGVSGFFWVLAL